MFQLAYEWLEIARVLYSRQEGKEAKLREAETLSFLGELKTEAEQLGPAKDDYKAAIELQKQFLDENDRQIATNHYQVKLACSILEVLIILKVGNVELFLSMPAEALESFTSAAAIIENNLIETKVYNM